MTDWLTIHDPNMESPVQVVPETASLWPTHILDDGCWCLPYRATDESRILIHRQDYFA